MWNLILDYDGTLHDCIRIYAPAFRLAYDQLVSKGDMPPRVWQDRELEKWLGLPAGEMWATFAPQLPQKERDRCSGVIGDEMLRLVRAGHARLYPEVPELLAAWRDAGYRLIFLSNCKRAYMDAHRQQFQLDRYFSGFYCAEDYGWRPKTALFPVIRDRFGGDFLVIGDRRQDMEIAHQYGLPSIGCAYGYAAPGELDGADAVVRSPAEITPDLGALTGM